MSLRGGSLTGCPERRVLGGTGSVGKTRGCQAPTGWCHTRKEGATSRIHFIECISISGSEETGHGKLTLTWVLEV